MADKAVVTQSSNHRHEWSLSDPFNFEGPIFECRCGEKRLETDRGAVPRTKPHRDAHDGSFF